MNKTTRAIERVRRALAAIAQETGCRVSVYHDPAGYTNIGLHGEAAPDVVSALASEWGTEAKPEAHDADRWLSATSPDGTRIAGHYPKTAWRVA